MVSRIARLTPGIRPERKITTLRRTCTRPGIWVHNCTAIHIYPCTGTSILKTRRLPFLRLKVLVKVVHVL